MLFAGCIEQTWLGPLSEHRRSLPHRNHWALPPMSCIPPNAIYATRFEAVLTHIQANLEGDLSVNTLSEIANFSTFHFHRQFTAYVGVPVARYVQLMRLRRAGQRLAGMTAIRYWTLRWTPASKAPRRSAVRFAGPLACRRAPFARRRAGSCGMRYLPFLIFPGVSSCKFGSWTLSRSRW